MFWYKRNTNNPWIPLLIAGIIIALLLVVAAIVAFSRVDVGDDVLGGEQDVADVDDADTTADVVETQVGVYQVYETKMTGLLTAVDQSASADEIVTAVEQTFFDVRVPKALLDAHMNAFLVLQEAAEGRSRAQLQTAVHDAVEPILAQAAHVGTATSTSSN